MGIPYIQLDTDFLHGTAKVAAALLGMRRREVVGMAADLIAFAVNETSTKDNPPDGCFVDPDATTILEAAMEWDGERGRAVTAFERAGLLEKLEIGYRVRGCDRYRATWEKNNRRRTGAKPEPMSPVTGANGPGNRTEPARNRPLDGDGDGEVEEQKKKEAPPARASAPVGALRDGIDAEFLRQRAVAYSWSHDDERALRQRMGEGTPEILRRWAIALAATWPRCSTVAVLCGKNWNEYAKGATGPPAKARDVSRGYVAAQTQDHGDTNGYLDEGGSRATGTND